MRSRGMRRGCSSQQRELTISGDVLVVVSPWDLMPARPDQKVLPKLLSAPGPLHVLASAPVPAHTAAFPWSQLKHLSSPPKPASCSPDVSTRRSPRSGLLPTSPASVPPWDPEWQLGTG